MKILALSSLAAAFPILAIACAHDAEKPMPQGPEGATSASASPVASTASAEGVTISNDEPILMADAGPSSASGPPPSLPSEACTKAADAYRLKIKDPVNACYQQGKAKNPFLSGRFKLTLAVDAQGTGAGHRVEGGSALGTSVTDCMLKAAKAVPFKDIACNGKSITVVRTYGSE